MYLPSVCRKQWGFVPVADTAKVLEFAPDVYWESIFTKWICQAAEIQAGPVLVCLLFEEQASRVLGTCCY